jgi:hypothetical protein
VTLEENDRSASFNNLKNQTFKNNTSLATLAQTTAIDRLKVAMEKSHQSQKLLQQWDKNIGLPCSHCATMMHTNRSRRQLQEERILRKWNGDPLIPNINTSNDNRIVVENNTIKSTGRN